MIDFSKFEKIAEYRNGELQWLEGRDINAVYVILVGDEYYIGSSHYTYIRIGQHLGELEHGHHHSQKLQDKFNEIGEFEVYSLDRGIEKAKLKAVEFQYIKKYRPSLNVIVPKEEERNQRKLTFRERIKYLAKDRGFSMEEVAQALGITRVTLSQNLSRNPTVNTLQKIADVIGCKVCDFFDDERVEDPNTIICPKCGARFKLEE